jgi:hypothetical protein
MRNENIFIYLSEICPRVVLLSMESGLIASPMFRCSLEREQDAHFPEQPDGFALELFRKEKNRTDSTRKPTTAMIR